MSAGSIDTSFGTAGQTTPFAMTIADVAVQADNKTVVVGTFGNKFAVGRLNADGQRDTSFGPNHSGLLTTSFSGSSGSAAQRVVVQPDGKILVAGYTSYGLDGQRFALARYNPNGTLDTSYGNGGTETVLGTNLTDGISALTLQSDGKIVFAGQRFHGGFLGFGEGNNVMVVRLQSNGALDGNFGDDNDGATPRKGYVVTDYDGFYQHVVGISIMNDGRIVVAGDADKVFIGRYTRDGRLDGSLDVDGIAESDKGGISAMAVDGSGRIYVAGVDNGLLESDMYVARWGVNGEPDTSFGNNGSVILNPGPAKTGAAVDSIILPAPGKILLVGRDKFYSPVAVQLQSSGAIDQTFGTHGVAQFDLGPNVLIQGSRAAVTPDGKVVLAATTTLDGPVVQPGNSPILRFTEEVPTVTLSVGVANALEGGHDGSILFQRDAAYNFNTRVYFSTSGTATPLVDYTGALAPAGQTVIINGHPVHISSLFKYIDIPAGQSATRVMVHAVDDTLIEPTETVTVTANADPSYVLGRTFNGQRLVFLNSATVSILDNDSPTAKTASAATSTAAAAVFSETSIGAGGTNGADAALRLAAGA
jgi:uncharacterized delta-60 repeat protein